MDAYPHLFSPITIGTLEIKNRGIMAPMVVGLCGRDGEVTEDFIAYHVARARGGVGLNITGGAFVEMTLEGRAPDGRTVELELMVPGNMVRMIVSARADAEFGFYDRAKSVAAGIKETVEPAPDAPPADVGGQPPALPTP